MRLIGYLGGFLATTFVLAGCATSVPLDAEAGFDSCDRQAEICLRDGQRDPVFDEYGRILDCEAQADRCFSRVYRDTERRYGARISENYVFYGRAGYWSPRYGWRTGPHGRPYTYDRDRYNDRYRRDPYYDPYYDPYRRGGYDDPYDCYGRLRASYCYDRNRDRDRDRDRGDDRDRQRPTEPSTEPNPKGDTPVPSRPVDEPRYVPRPTPPVQQAPEQPRRSSPSEPARSRPMPEPRPEARPRPQPRPERSTPAPQPERTTPKPAPRSKPKPAPNPRESRDTEQVR